MQWEGMTPSLYAGVVTGALLGGLTGAPHTLARAWCLRDAHMSCACVWRAGGPYNALLGMSTVGGLAVVGEGAAAVYNRWYNKKREQIKQLRLIERRQVRTQRLYIHT
jgi:hypothetical protein